MITASTLHSMKTPDENAIKKTFDSYLKIESPIINQLLRLAIPTYSANSYCEELGHKVENLISESQRDIFPLIKQGYSLDNAVLTCIDNFLCAESERCLTIFKQKDLFISEGLKYDLKKIPHCIFCKSYFNVEELLPIWVKIRTALTIIDDAHLALKIEQELKSTGTTNQTLALVDEHSILY